MLGDIIIITHNQTATKGKFVILDPLRLGNPSWHSKRREERSEDAYLPSPLLYEILIYTIIILIYPYYCILKI